MKTKVLFIFLNVALVLSIGNNLMQKNQTEAFLEQKQSIVSVIHYYDREIILYEQKVQENNDKMKEYAEGSYAYNATQNEALRYQKLAKDLAKDRLKHIELLINL